MRRAFGAFALAVALACGARRSDPAAVVDAYFRALGADPMRTLALVTEGFHATHGLQVVSAGAATALREGGAAPGSAAAGGVSLDRRQLGWLGVQARPGYADAVAALRVEASPPRVDGERAEVDVRVEPPGAPPFEQRFVLARDDRGWRIDAIEQHSVVAANAMAAFVASPSERARGALEQSLKRR